MEDRVKSTGAVALVAGGMAAAFSLAACCAIPIMLAGVGLSAGWLAPVVPASQPHAGALTAFSGVALLGGVAVVARAPTTCMPGSLCSGPTFRWTVIIAAVIGAALLILSKFHA